MRKRFAAFILFIIMLGALSGIVSAAQEEFVRLGSGEAAVRRAGLASDASSPRALYMRIAALPYTSSYGAQLGGNAREVYDAMKAKYADALGSGQLKVTLKQPITFTVEDYVEETWDRDKGSCAEYQAAIDKLRYAVQAACDAFAYDFPQVCWIESIYLNGFGMSRPRSISGNWTGSINSVYITPSELYSGASGEMDAFNAAVNAACAEIQTKWGVSASSPGSDRAKAIHDYLCQKLTYGEGSCAHSALGAFLKGGRVVCEGYAKVYKILCEKFGVASALIVGMPQGDSAPHMWNYVQMEDGNWYLVDVTWDDQTAAVYSTYFLAGSSSVGFRNLPVSQERTIYTNFSGSSNTMNFAVPVLSGRPYAQGGSAAVHTHSWKLIATEATCQKAGKETYQCSECGDMTVAWGEGGHKFENYVSNHDATCQRDGTKTAKCEYGCGVEDTIADPGTKTGHLFTDYESNHDATCQRDGTKTAECAYGCGEENTVTDPGTKVPHVFNQYVSDQNATCLKDGTKTAKCEYGCGRKNTITDRGSKKAHLYQTYKSNHDATCLKDGTKTALCVYGCGKKKTVKDTGSRLKATILLNYTSLTLQCGQTSSALKVSNLGKGDSVASWKSSKTSVVKVNSKGKLTAGKKTGSAKVTVTLKSGLKKNVTVKVQKKKVSTTKISVPKKKISLKVGATYKLEPVRSPVTSQEKITYSSSDKKTATVSSKGVVKAKAPGTARITVKSGKKTVKVTVTVQRPAVSRITGVPQKLSMKKGKTGKLSPALYPKGSSGKLKYSSSNKKIVRVSDKGKLTAVKKGSAYVTVKCGKISVKCKVTVK